MARFRVQLHALNATTGSVVEALVVNGSARHTLGLPMGAGCLGGVAGHAPAIGRALRLVLRNVAGQHVGVTSQSVWGQPGRVAGIVFGEWEERSPWAPLAERRGVAGDAVTVIGAMGTMNICDPLASTADESYKRSGGAWLVRGSMASSPDCRFPRYWWASTRCGPASSDRPFLMWPISSSVSGSMPGCP